MSRTTKTTLVTALVLAALPLVPLGYGSNEDAWLTALAARSPWAPETHVRRSLGFPLYELLVTPLVRYGGWYLSNLASVAFGVTMLLALFHLADRGRFSHPAATVLSISFLPVFVINCATSLDYVATTAILLWAYAFMLDGRYSACATLVGIACGFRPTSAPFIVPCALYVYASGRDARLVIRTVAIAAVVGLIAFSPSWIRYGFFQDLSVLKIGFGISMLSGMYYFLKVLGVVQTLVVIPLLGLLLWRARRAQPGFLSSPFFLFHATVIVLWLLLYWLPMAEFRSKPEYLLPLVPSVIFLIDKTVTRGVFYALTTVLLSYHLVQLDVLGGESGARRVEPSVKAGLTIADAQDRIFQLSVRDLATTCEVDRPTVLMFGAMWVPVDNDGWVLDPEYGMYRQRNGNLFVSERITDESKLRDLAARGVRLLVWRGRKWEYAYTDVPWDTYVEVIDSLDEFFGAPVNGKLSQ